jgi:DNA polymerase-1
MVAEPDDPGSAEPTAGRWLRARGRFTRNFVVQASAADWATVFLAGLRRRLAIIQGLDGSLARPPGVPLAGSGEAAAAGGGDGRPCLVFFQHDEVIVHSPRRLAADVVTAIGESAVAAGRLVFGPTQVRFPVTTAEVTSYADAK